MNESLRHEEKGDSSGESGKGSRKKRLKAMMRSFEEKGHADTNKGKERMKAAQSFEQLTENEAGRELSINPEAQAADAPESAESNEKRTLSEILKRLRVGIKEELVGKNKEGAIWTRKELPKLIDEDIHEIENLLAKKDNKLTEAERIGYEKELDDLDRLYKTNYAKRILIDLEYRIKTQLASIIKEKKPIKESLRISILNDIREFDSHIKRFDDGGEKDELSSQFSELKSEYQNITKDLPKIELQKEKNTEKKKGEEKPDLKDNTLDKPSQKPENKTKVQSETIKQLRSDEVAILLSEVNSALYASDIQIATLNGLKNKLKKLKKTVEAAKIVDNFTNQPLEDKELVQITERVEKLELRIQKTNDQIVKEKIEDVRNIMEEYKAQPNGVNIRPKSVILAINDILSVLKDKDQTTAGIKAEMQEYLKVIGGLNDAVKEKKKDNRDLNHLINKAVEFTNLSDIEILNRIGAKGDKAIGELEKENADLELIISKLEDENIDFKIAYLDDKENSIHDIDNKGESFDTRRKNVLEEMRKLQNRYKVMLDKLLQTKESSINACKEAKTFSDIKDVIDNISHKRIGGMDKILLINNIELLTAKTDEEYIEIAKSGIENFEVLLQQSSIDAYPSSYGIREAVVRISNEKLKNAHKKLEGIRKEEAAVREKEREEEEKKVREEKNKNRKIITKGNILSKEFKSIDQALNEPGFAQFLALRDERFGDDASMRAVEQEGVEYVKSVYEKYVQAREVSEGIKAIFNSEIKKDFGDRLNLPSNVFSNIDDYILECAIKDHQALDRIREQVSSAIEIPKRITEVENDVSSAYAMFGGEEGLISAEQHQQNKEEELRILKESSGLDKEDMAQQLKDSKIVSLTLRQKILQKVPSQKGKIRAEILESGLRELHKSLSISENSLERFKASSDILYQEGLTTEGLFLAIDAMNKVDRKLGRTHNSGWEADHVELETSSSDPIVTPEESQALLSTITEPHDTYPDIEKKMTDRRNIVTGIRTRLYSSLENLKTLSKKTESAIESKPKGYLDRLDYVSELAQQGLIEKDTSLAKRVMNPNALIRQVAEKMGADLQASRARIQSVREKVHGAEEQRKQLLQTYSKARQGIFYGIAAIDQKKELISGYVKEQLFGEEDIQEQKLQRGDKESAANFQARIDAEKKRVETERHIAAERKLAAIRHLQKKEEARNWNESDDSIEDIDEGTQLRYLNYSQMFDTEASIKERVKAGLEKRINDAIQESEKKLGETTISDLETIIKHWILRPPQIVLAKEQFTDKDGKIKTRNTSRVEKAHEDAVQGDESLIIIRQILEEKITKMKSREDAPKRMILARIISKIKNRTL
ncbi:MAG: hypothetical protein FGM57_03220 [Candidatus Taylorbacteria bacterium]|nr:hypothetical protein [Candidatus Taylorbacteria bacterium]